MLHHYLICRIFQKQSKTVCLNDVMDIHAVADVQVSPSGPTIGMHLFTYLKSYEDASFFSGPFIAVEAGVRMQPVCPWSPG
jgi:hypothetical protein